jgi:hypothetical protein
VDRSAFEEASTDSVLVRLRARLPEFTGALRRVAEQVLPVRRSLSSRNAPEHHRQPSPASAGPLGSKVMPTCASRSLERPGGPPEAPAGPSTLVARSSQPTR